MLSGEGIHRPKRSLRTIYRLRDCVGRRLPHEQVDGGGSFAPRLGAAAAAAERIDDLVLAHQIGPAFLVAPLLLQQQQRRSIAEFAAGAVDRRRRRRRRRLRPSGAGVGFQCRLPAAGVASRLRSSRMQNLISHPSAELRKGNQFRLIIANAGTTRSRTRRSRFSNAKPDQSFIRMATRRGTATFSPRINFDSDPFVKGPRLCGNRYRDTIECYLKSIPVIKWMKLNIYLSRVLRKHDQPFDHFSTDLKHYLEVGINC